MTLKLGDTASKFSLPSRRGEDVDVGACFGDAPVVLLFFPFAYSSVCTAELCQFRDEWQQWGSLGCKVFGISIDSMFVTEKFRADLSIPFPLLSDFNKTVSATWGALHEDLMGLKGVTKRATFVIDRTGKISYAAVQESPGEQIDFEALRAAVHAAT